MAGLRRSPGLFLLRGHRHLRLSRRCFAHRQPDRGRGAARLYEHLLRQDMRFFQDRHSTEFMTAPALAANGVRDTLQVIITSTGRDLLTLIGLIIVMIVQDPLMAVMALTGHAGRRLFRSAGSSATVRKSARRSYDGSARIMETMQETPAGHPHRENLQSQDHHAHSAWSDSVREVERSVNSMAAGMAVSSPHRRRARRHRHRRRNFLRLVAGDDRARRRRLVLLLHRSAAAGLRAGQEPCAP